MKLIYCNKCNDIFRLFKILRFCKCKKCCGKYINNRTAIFSGSSAVPMGIDNNSLKRVLQGYYKNGFYLGTQINTFFIVEPCNTFRRIKMGKVIVNTMQYVNHSEIMSSVDNDEFNEQYLGAFPAVGDDNTNIDGVIMLQMDEYITLAENTLDSMDCTDSDVQQSTEILEELRALDDTYVNMND